MKDYDKFAAIATVAEVVEVLNEKDAEIARLKAIVEDLSDHGCATERMDFIKTQSAQIERLKKETDNSWRLMGQKDAEIERLNEGVAFQKTVIQDQIAKNLALKALLAEAEEWFRDQGYECPVDAPTNLVLRRMREASI